MELVLVRHLQTPGNLKKQYIGVTDEPLAETAEHSEMIAKRQVDCQGTEQVISSPMKRCIQTAKLLFPKETPIICEKMRECNFGLFEGKSYEELKEHAEYQKWLDYGGKIPFPEGEDHEVFKRRCAEGFGEMVEKLAKQKMKQAVMVVHGGTIMAVLESIDSQKRPFYHWQPENGGGYRVILDETEWMQGKKCCREIWRL